MPSACGLACEVCGLRDMDLCPTGGCVPGTDPEAPKKLKNFEEATGHPCAILECAIEKGVDHCTRCEEFPCDIHYNQQKIYSEDLLDMIKEMLEKVS